MTEAPATALMQTGNRDPKELSLEGLDLRVAPNQIYETHQEKLSAIVNKFLQVQTHYSARDRVVQNRRAFFAGNHWAEDDEDLEEQEFQLTINYTRRVVLDFAGMLARAPKPRVPMTKVDAEKARRREKLLQMVWDDLLEAWRRAELNASKCGYGVIQALWDPPQKETLKPMGPDSETTITRYVENPFTFRSIKPEHFYPVYNTFDKSDNFLYLFRFDPNRLATQLSLRYDVDLLRTGPGLGLDYSDAEPTVDLIEYWDDQYYILVARALVKIEPVNRREQLMQALGRAPSQRHTHVVLDVLEHKHNRPPFWVVENITNTDADPTDEGAISDIDDIAGVNQHLNLMRSEQAEEVIINIHRAMVYASADHEQDPTKIALKGGAVIPIGEDETLDVLDYPPQPGFISEHVNSIEQTIRTLSFLGDAGFGEFGAGTSGVAARIALTPMQRILELKLPPRLYALRGISKHILRQFEKQMPKDTKFRGWIQGQARRLEVIDVSPEDIQGQYYADVEYGNLLPRDDEAFEQHQAFLYKSGMQSLEETLDKIGRQDPQASIEKIREEANDPAIDPDKFLAVKRAEAEAKKLEQEAQQPPPGQGGQGGMGGDQQGDIAALFGAAAGGQGGAPNPPGTAIPPTGPPPGGRETAPTVPSNMGFPRSPGGGGFGAGALAPFLSRTQQGGNTNRQEGQIRPGMGRNVGGGG